MEEGGRVAIDNNNNNNKRGVCVVRWDLESECLEECRPGEVASQFPALRLSYVSPLSLHSEEILSPPPSHRPSTECSPGLGLKGALAKGQRKSLAVGGAFGGGTVTGTDRSTGTGNVSPLKAAMSRRSIGVAKSPEGGDFDGSAVLRNASASLLSARLAKEKEKDKEGTGKKRPVDTYRCPVLRLARGGTAGKSRRFRWQRRGGGGRRGGEGASSG